MRSWTDFTKESTKDLKAKKKELEKRVRKRIITMEETYVMQKIKDELEVRGE